MRSDDSLIHVQPAVTHFILERIVDRTIKAYKRFLLYIVKHVFQIGGPELVKQLLNKTYDIKRPEVIAIYLDGEPAKGVSSPEARAVWMIPTNVMSWDVSLSNLI